MLDVNKARSFLEAIYAPILRLPYGDKWAHSTGGIVAFIPMITSTTYLGMGLFAWFCGYVWEFFFRWFRGDEVSHLDAAAVGIGGFVLSLIPLWMGAVPFVW